MTSSAQQRATVLRADPEIDEVHLARVSCHPCKEWVVLQEGAEYDLRGWFKHRAQRSHVMLAAGLQYRPGPGRPRRGRRSSGSSPLTEQERVAMLKADMDINEVAEHRVSCRPCQRWVALNKGHLFSISEWLTHKGCTEHMRQVVAGRLELQPSGSESGPSRRSHGPFAERPEELSVRDHDGEEGHPTSRSISPVIIVSQSPSPSFCDDTDGLFHTLRTRGYSVAQVAASLRRRHRLRQTLNQRVEILHAETDIEDVQEHRVFCRPCAKWVLLHNQTKYGLAMWFRHKKRSEHRRSVASRSVYERDVPLGNGVTLQSEQAVHQYQDRVTIDLTLKEEDDDDEELRQNILKDSSTPQCPLSITSESSQPSGSSQLGDPMILSPAMRSRQRSSEGPTEAIPPLVEDNDDEPSLYGDSPMAIASCDAPTMLNFIKSYLPPTTHFTEEELDIAARVMQEVVREGAPITVETAY